MRQDDICVTAVLTALEHVFARQFCEEEANERSAYRMTGKSISQGGRKERRQQQKSFQRMMAKTKQTRPICTKKGVVWGVSRER